MGWLITKSFTAAKEKEVYFCDCVKLEWIFPKIFHPCGTIPLLLHQSLLPLILRTGSRGIGVREKAPMEPAWGFECRASISQASAGLQYPKRWFCFCFSKRLKIDHSLSSHWPLTWNIWKNSILGTWKWKPFRCVFEKKKKIKNLSVKITRQIVQVLWGSLPTVTLVPLLSNNGMLEQEGKNPTTHLCPEALDRMFALPGIFWLTLFTWHPFKELSGEVALAPKET